MFTNHVWDNVTNGFKQDIPLIFNLKPKKLRVLTITPNLNYSAVAYSSYINKHRELYTDTTTIQLITGLSPLPHIS